MSRTSHELAILTQVEALVTNLKANDFATVKGFTETYFFSQEDLDGNVILYIEAHPTLRGEIIAISATNITTDITAGGSLVVGDTDPNAYLDTIILVLEANNENDATDQDGVAQIYPLLGNAAGGRGVEYVITASDLVELLFTDVSTDTGIFDLAVTIRWFE